MNALISGDKPLVWLHGEVKSPPFSAQARVEVGYFLRMLQGGRKLALPHSRPLPIVGFRCHELRITDNTKSWRVVYRADPDAIIVLEVFEKQTATIPKWVIEVCKKRLRNYDNESEQA